MSSEQGRRENDSSPYISKGFFNSQEHRIALIHYSFRHAIPEMIGVSLIALGSIVGGWPKWPIVGIGVMAALCGLYLRDRKEKWISALERERDECIADGEELRLENEQTIRKLRDENFQLGVDSKALQSNIVSLIDKNLEIWARAFDLRATERISVYIYRRESSVFEGIARYCAIPPYDSFVRDVYPEGVGCIGLALKNGECILPDMPDPEVNADDWAAYQYTHTRLDTAISTKMRLKARSMGAFVVENTRRVGVVVIESTRTDVLDFDRIREGVANESRQLADILELIEENSESARSAAEEGY